jgi:hypothetical protein
MAYTMELGRCDLNSSNKENKDFPGLQLEEGNCLVKNPINEEVS